eukprot:m.140887 g.140887  ORF g.140887 m.140887 type:complete len:73 (-) comp22828_c0_seq7:984-1202(-)
MKPNQAGSSGSLDASVNANTPIINTAVPTASKQTHVAKDGTRPPGYVVGYVEKISAVALGPVTARVTPERES